jgi:hypothetical protein
LESAASLRSNRAHRRRGELERLESVDLVKDMLVKHMLGKEHGPLEFGASLRGIWIGRRGTS